MYYITAEEADKRRKIAKFMMARWNSEINKSKENPRINITRDDCKALGYNMIFHLLLSLNKEIINIAYDCFTYDIIVYLEKGDEE